MKKIISVIMSLLLLGSFCVGCGGAEKDPPGTVRLIVWTANPLVANYEHTLQVDPANVKAKFTKDFVEAFQKENPNVKLQLQDKNWGDKLNENLLQAVKTGMYMDVVPGEAYIKSYIEAGHFAEINLGDKKSELIEKALLPGEKDGKTYAVPVETGTFSLLINKAVLKDAKIIDANDVASKKYKDLGIDPLCPVYWEDLLSICNDIKKYYEDANKGKSNGGMLINTTPGGSQWRTLNYMRTAGGDFLDADGNFMINSDGNVRAFNLMRDLAKTAPTSSLSVTQDNLLFNYFTGNAAAYMLEGIDPIVRSKGTKSEGQIAVAEIPTFKVDGVKANVMVGTVYYSVMEKSRNKELAQKFIEFMLRDEWQTRVTEIDYRVPVKKALIEGDTLKNEKYHYEIMEKFYKPFVDPTYSFNGGVPGFAKNQGLIWESWDSFMKKVVKENTDIKTLADSANKDMNAKKDR